MEKPDYGALDEYKSYGGSDEGEGNLPASLMMLAEKLGFDEEKAMALKDFIHECMAADDAGDYDDEDGE